MGTINRLFLLPLAALASMVNVVILYSNQTPQSLQNYLHDNIGPFLSQANSNLGGTVVISLQQTLVATEDNVLHVFDTFNPIAVLNLTFDVSTWYYIAKLAEQRGVPDFSFSIGERVRSEVTFFTHLTWEHHAEALEVVLTHFGWDEYSMVSSVDDTSNSISDALTTSPSSRVYLSTTDQSDKIRQQVARKIKSTGTRITILTSSGDITLAALRAFEDKRLGVQGYAYLLSSFASCFHLDQESLLQNDGLLLVTEEGQEQARTEEEMELSRIGQVLILISHALSSNQIALLDGLVVSSKVVLSYFRNLWPSQMLPKNLTLVNVQNGGRVAIGTIHGGMLSIPDQGKIVFPGKTSKVPQNVQAVIPCSMNRDTFNPPPAPIFEVASIWYQGCDLAVDHVNDRKDILPNHLLNRFDYGAGASYFVYEYTEAQLELVKDQLGYVTVSSGSSGMTMGLMTVMNDLEIDIPVVGGANTGIPLSDPVAWPNYMRVILSDLFLPAVYAQMFQLLRWTKCAILYGDEVWGQGVYETFLNQAAQFGIEILNDEDKRAIPSDISESNMPDHLHKYQHIIDIGARIVLIVILSPGPKLSLEAFYDLGVRRGTMIFMGIEWLSTNLVNDPPEEQALKRKELALGSIQFFPASWIDVFGQYVRDSILEKYNDLGEYSWFFYDAWLAIAYTMDWMVSRGLDFEEPTEFRRIFFDQAFTGWTGLITYQQGTNDRSPINYDIHNMQIVDGEWKVVTVGQYSPTSSQVFRLDQDIIWPDGTSDIPSDTVVVDYECPFPDDEQETFVLGAVIAYLFCFLVAALTGIITLAIWRKYWQKAPEVLHTKQEISVNDLVIMSTVLIDFMQFSAMGPDFRSLNELIATTADAASVDISALSDLKDGGFFIMVQVVMSLTGFWLLLVLMIIQKIDIRLHRFAIWKNLGQIAENVLPVLGNACFLPIISVLLDVYICDEAYGDTPYTFSDSFLARDCFQTWWQGDHLIYAVLGVFSLTAYHPLAVYTRPLWQDYQADLHIRMLPLFLMVKSVTQIVLITLWRTIQRSSEITHGGMFVMIMCFYCLFNYKVQTFNYDRIWLWNFLACCGALWIGFLGTLNIRTGLSVAYVVLMFMGWSILLLWGIYIQQKKYPSMLYSKKNIEFSILFRFAFRRDNRNMVETVKRHLSFKSTDPISIKMHGNPTTSANLDNTMTAFDATTIANIEHEDSISWNTPPQRPGSGHSNRSGSIWSDNSKSIVRSARSVRYENAEESVYSQIDELEQAAQISEINDDEEEEEEDEEEK